ncbi:uncharacterized protein UHOD_04717 [Ustilago sp. UG-2017b]|nr:uncharacterized protein UHOD_04717 [Ustilago sp. UG-2017b]
MSDFKSKALFEQISDGLKSMDDKEKKDIQKKTNGCFEMHVKNAGGKELVWTIDLKKVRFNTQPETCAFTRSFAVTSAQRSPMQPCNTEATRRRDIGPSMSPLLPFAVFGRHLALPYDSARLASTPHRRRPPQWSCKERLSRSHLVRCSSR